MTTTEHPQPNWPSWLPISPISRNGLSSSRPTSPRSSRSRHRRHDHHRTAHDRPDRLATRRGRRAAQSSPRTPMDMLYTGRRHEAGFRQGKFVIWRRPARRWTQFGSRNDLLNIASLHGAEVNRRDSRKWIIRTLWRCRGITGRDP